MILNLTFEPQPQNIIQFDMATDGSFCRAYTKIDADGVRHASIYKRHGDKMVLQSSASYRLDADGVTWTKVGPDIFYGADRPDRVRSRD